MMAELNLSGLVRVSISTAQRSTYKKCKRTEERPSITQAIRLSRAMLRKIRILGTPISSHRHSVWALSASFRVGETRSCMQKLEELNNSVRDTLSRWLTLQSPLYILPKSPSGFHRIRKVTVAATLKARTIPRIMQHVANRTSRRECHVCHVLARGLLGSTSGNHGERSVLDGKRT